MKTTERILLASLELFNQYGEPNVSSVDIANELDISPGNMYYHFKGKEIIIAALFDMYQQRMSKILLASDNDTLTIEDFFYYILMISEVSHLFLFLYRNPTEISEKYPRVAKSFSRILAAKKKVFKSCIKSFSDRHLLTSDIEQQHQMVELISLIFSQTQNYQTLQGKDISNGAYIYDAISAILFAIAPYMVIEKNVFEELRLTILSQQNYSGSD